MFYFENFMKTLQLALIIGVRMHEKSCLFDGGASATL